MKTRFRKITAYLLTLCMLMTLLPAGTLTAFATEDSEAFWGDPTDTTSGSNGTFAQAVEAANAADSTVGYIRLSRSVELTETAAFNPAKSLTLDLNNLTLSAAATVSPVISVTGGNVTIADSIGGGSITATGGNVFAVSGGTLTLNGGAYSAAASSAVISYSGGSIVITGTKNDAVTISFATAVDDVSTVVTLPTDWALHDADGQEVSGSVTQGTTLTACAKASEVASGNEGNVTWKITGNAAGYTLTISGTGAMADYSSSSSQPWYSYRENITKVVVGEGITHVGKYAFIGSGESKLETVSLPSGLESIGERAFAACPYLKEAAIPAGVTSIGEGVFYECSSLESITIPDSVTAIPDDCFSGCSKLETIHIGSGVTSIGSYVFDGCTSLTGFTVSDSNANYKAVDGVLFSEDEKTLLAYPAAKAGEYTIPSDVETIAENAFAYSKVTSVTIPASVTTIGDYCFSECESLTQFVVAEGNSSYSAVDGVLLYEEYEGQTTLIAWPGGKTGAVTVPDGVETIAAYAFLACAVTSVTLPDSLTTIGEYAFYDCTSLSEIVLPAGVTDIGGNAFYDCTALATVTFHSAPTLGNYVFGGCTGLTTLNLYAVPAFDLNEYGTFSGCTLSNITVNLLCNDEANVSTFTTAGFTTVSKSLHADSDTDDDELCDGCGTSLHTHAWENGVCTNGCAETHDHEESDWANKDGICKTCGGKCTHGGETPTYANGVCTTCGAAHNPHSYTNGFCTVCGGYEPAGGDGFNTPFTIGNAGQLYWFANYVNTTYPGVDAVLIADITVNTGVLDEYGNLAEDTSSFKDWTPIGDATDKYTGTFDGRGHIISGLYFNDSTAEFVGLFGLVRNGTVKNVGVVDSYFCGKNTVGGVVGQCDARFSDSASVENCYNTGIVKGTLQIGGVVGYLYSDGAGSKASIENCYNTGDVSGISSSGSTYVGGVVGQNHGAGSGTATVANCYNTGKVNGGTYSYYVGGVVGDNYASNNGTATIENCYYLTGCATDGKVSQNGIGASSYGNATDDDVSGKVTAVKDEETFKSGAVAYLLNGDDAGTDAGVWKQTLGDNGDASPNFTGKTVYQSGTGYTNHEHNWSYEASGNQIQAKCNGTDCTLTGSVTITLTALGGTYDGTTAYPVSITFTPADAKNVMDLPAITYTKDNVPLADGQEPIDAGEYTATLTLGEGTDAKEAKVTYTIAPKDITDATAGTFGDLTYTGEAQTPSATVTLDGKTVTGSWSTVTNVGEESTFTASGNYTGTLTRNPGMKPKTITITGATIKDVLYNENGGYTLNVTNVTFDGATLTIGEDYTASAELAGENQIANGVAATVTVTLSNDNYSLNSNTFNGSVNIITHTHVWSYSASENVITAKCEGKDGICPVGTVTITLKAPTSLTYDGSEKVVTVEQSLKGVFSDLTSDVKYTVKYEGDSEYSDINVPIGAGSYKATLTLGTATAEVTFTIDKVTISNVTLNVTDPVQGEEPQSTVTAAEGYYARIAWDTEETTFGFNTAYTATVTLYTDGNHQFADNFAVADWTVKSNNGSKVVLERTFDKTRKAELQSVTAPDFEKFSEYHTAVDSAISKLPTYVTYETESGNVNAEIQWTCENYNSATTAVNTFTWTVKDGELADYANADNIATTGTITVTNANPIDVNNTHTDKVITYNGNTYDVAQMFTKDTNAGETTYSIVGGTGEGTLDGSTLTITKAGTIEIKMTTASNGAYDAGEATATLTVNKGTGSSTVTMADWTYGETAKAPVPTSTTNGTANVTYRYTDDHGYNSVTVPTDAGTYTVTATFAATDLYEAATAEDTFTIAKADPTAPTGLTVIYGQTLADVTLPDNWTWVTSGNAVGNVGDQAHKANFSGDTNHNAKNNVEVTVKVTAKTIATDGVTISKTEAIYNTEAQKPTITIEGLTENTDYTVTWDKDGFIKVDTYTATIKGIGNYTGTVQKTFEIKKADPVITVTPPVSSVLPGNTILLTVTANDSEVNSFTVAAGTNYTVEGFKITVAESVVIGQDKLTIKVTSAETDNYNAGEATIELPVGMVDFTSEISDLQAQITELNELVASKADTKTIEGKITEISNRIKALEDNGATDAEVTAAITAAKTELTTAYTEAIKKAVEELETKIAAQVDPTELADAIGDVTDLINALDDTYATDTAVSAAIEQAKKDVTDAYTTALNNAVVDLETKIAAQIDPTELADAISDVTDLINALDDTYATDAKLAEAISKAETELASAVSTLEDKITEEVGKLQEQIDANDTDIEGINESITTINGLIDALKAADVALGGDISDAIAKAESELKAAQEELEKLIGDVQTNLDNAKAEIDQAIAQLDAAMKQGDADLSAEIASLNTALTNAQAALEKADADNKAELVAKIEAADATLDAAIKAVQKNLDDAKVALDKAIADGDSALDEKITNLNNALTSAQAALEATDAANKSELEGKITDAQSTLQAAIDKVQSNLDNVEAALKKAIEDLDAAVKAGDKNLSDRIDALNTALTDAQAALEATDAANKSELEGKITDAQSTLQAAIDKVAKDLADAKTALEQALAAGDKANADALAQAIVDLNAAIDAAEAAATTADTALKADLEGQISSAKSSLQSAIDGVASDLANAEKELADAIASGDSALDAKITALNEALEAAKKAYNAADASLQDTLTAKIEAADAALDEAIKAVQKNLDDAKAELNKAIADGDTALDGKISALNEALATAKAALEAADTTNKSELTTKIDEAYASLDSAVKAVQKNLDDLKAQLEKADADNKAALEAKDAELQTFIIIVCVISGVALCGSGAFVVWFFIDRKKKI